VVVGVAVTDAVNELLGVCERVALPEKETELVIVDVCVVLLLTEGVLVVLAL
jgi:hypothetical protein